MSTLVVLQRNPISLYRTLLIVLLLLCLQAAAVKHCTASHRCSSPANVAQPPTARDRTQSPTMTCPKPAESNRVSSTSSAGLKQIHLDAIPLPLSVQGNPLDPLRLGANPVSSASVSCAHTLCSNKGETDSPALHPTSGPYPGNHLAYSFEASPVQARVCCCTLHICAQH